MQHVADRLHHMAEEVEHLSEALEQLRMAPAQNDQPQSTAHRLEWFQGPARTGATLRALTMLADDELRSTHPGPPESADALAAERERALRAIERGLLMRCVYARSHLETPTGQRHLRELADAGVRVRVQASVPVRIILVGDRLALFADKGVGDPESLTMVRHPQSVALAARVFEERWAEATDLETLLSGTGGDRAGGSAGSGLSSREQVILRRLADGGQDEAIAREIGVSIRTYRRDIVTLLDKLSAKNRVQAAVEAVRRGWL
ncbi:LuxR C-terminal-related transcriptional regulator [Streptomyces caelestis]|jgi:DNA-binding CsgD family transcriptional regulator|uniref:DNA-binding CsgD family transcriptional regulator n=1 Tax=Streptomyces caelestis TaxID=36816 RepID=A0A7W9H072_9ACTN|nr:LuxR C-terminal-related transcriptional regulator [Streptomyces caelestis]MBB5792906.1 DNA-binding CsgD family transcriptional regulator [Streptomyces caelestis]GGW75692.1 hypothetical protein GCM10010320_67020 [Streptomyces caelestis]